MKSLSFFIDMKNDSEDNKRNLSGLRGYESYAAAAAKNFLLYIEDGRDRCKISDENLGNFLLSH